MFNQTMTLKSACVACAISLALSACVSQKPKPYTQDEIDKRVAADQAVMYEKQEPVTHPITFYEAAARALKYNLDYRLKLMEGALAANLRDVSAYEMLPKLVVAAGYAGRNNDSGGTSIGIVDRQVSLRPSTSEERYHDVYNLGLSWSLLDFGVAYYRNQQKIDQIQMAEERRRKVEQNVLQDVRNAYWRALAAQRLMPEVDQLLQRSNQALASAREAESRGLAPKQELLAYQRALLDSIYLLTVRRQDLEFAQAELSALMSLPPGSRMVLAEDAEPALPRLKSDIDSLEQLALHQRPEIMEEWYRKRVDDNDIKVAKLNLWPNVSLSAGYNYDTNKYLYNNHWSETGLQVSINLLRLLQYPSLNRAQDAQRSTDDMRRIALSMAVLTQVRVGALRYELATEELGFADQSLEVDKQLFNYAQAAKTTSIGSQLEVIRAEGRYLLSRYQREAAYSDAQASWGRLYNSVGLDVFPDAVENYDVATLAKAIEHTMNTLDPSQPSAAPSAPLPPPASTPAPAGATRGTN